MELKKLQAKIDELQAEVDRLKQEGEDLFWFPKRGEDYFVIDHYGGIKKAHSATKRCEELARKREELGTLFKTKEEAENQVRVMKTFVKLSRLARKSWGDEDHLKHKGYFIGFDRWQEVAKVFHTQTNFINSIQPLFKTRHDALNAIETIGTEELKVLCHMNGL